MDHFGTSRYGYLHPPDGDGTACVGNAAECDDLTQDGAVRIRWGGEPRPEDVAGIRCLHLRPSPTRLREPALPAFLPDLPALRQLVLPTPLVPHLGRGGVGGRLAALVVSHDHTHPIPAAPLRADVALPALRALMWVASAVPPTLPRVLDPLPPLEFLRVNVSGDPAVLRRLRDLTTLRHLELVDLRDVDVFDHLDAPLRVLEVTGAGRGFPVARLPSLPALESLRLNGVRAEIDCAVFRELPELVELVVLNSRKVVNARALLDCPKLAGVTFVDCGNPFKGGGKALFEAKGFAHLDIDWS